MGGAQALVGCAINKNCFGWAVLIISLRVPGMSQPCVLVAVLCSPLGQERALCMHSGPHSSCPSCLRTDILRKPKANCVAEMPAWTIAAVSYRQCALKEEECVLHSAMFVDQTPLRGLM